MADVNHHIILATARGASNQKRVFNGNVPQVVGERRNR